MINKINYKCSIELDFNKFGEDTQLENIFDDERVLQAQKEAQDLLKKTFCSINIGQWKQENNYYYTTDMNFYIESELTLDEIEDELDDLMVEIDYCTQINVDRDIYFAYLIEEKEDEILEVAENAAREVIEKGNRMNILSGFYINIYIDKDGDVWDTTPMDGGSFLSDGMGEKYSCVRLYSIEAYGVGIGNDDIGDFKEFIHHYMDTEYFNEFRDYLIKKYSLNLENEDLEDLDMYLNWEEYESFDEKSYKSYYEASKEALIDEHVEYIRRECSDSIYTTVKELKNC